jgi:mRNA-degrading endonuclease RelE of RelBE toxin-antitoxin system
MFSVMYQAEALEDLRRVRVFDRVRILDDVERHLTEEPLRMSGHRRALRLPGRLPIFQLKVGDYRVFYDVDTVQVRVIVRHVHAKGRKHIEEVL